MTRAGYLTWRAKQKSLAASNLSTLLSTSPSITPPLPEPTIARIAALVRKEGLASGDEEAQALEDVACLVFLDDQFDGFEERADIDEDKIIAILRKTWAKMGEEGRRLAGGMALSERAGTLVKKALEGV
ncbi:glutamyl-tRNA synthetase [Staphylotrichum tortipilum]|uniref:Glutamyl-tRNA synthetase n=1 Tax=Staphylotrichum tortipilum TaxID=2831512 RepID=A0AAN6M8D7_9PEZI|nr:glutamyl-tRNA synthetase [Staphylotrichum longicolle]